MKLKKVYIINKEMRMERTNQNTNNDHDDGGEMRSSPRVALRSQPILMKLFVYCERCVCYVREWNSGNYVWLPLWQPQTTSTLTDYQDWGICGIVRTNVRKRDDNIDICVLF